MSDSVCTVRHAVFLKSRLRRWLHNPDEILGGLIHPGQTVADLGCGPGFFTVPMARLVGPGGRVVAIDLQREMLDMVRRAAMAGGIGNRITFHQCSEDDIGWSSPVDFALAFYMLHEVPDAARFLRQTAALLNPGARLLLVEPKFHVSRRRFEAELALALNSGFHLIGEPRIRFSRSSLLERT